VALALGSLFLYTPESALAVDRRLVAAAVGTLASILVLVGGVLLADRRRRPRAGSEGMVDEIAVALTDLDPNGKIKVRGEIWNASSRNAVAAGQRVRIVALRGLEADVEPERKEGKP